MRAPRLSLPLLLFALALALGGCPKPAERGRPEALNPILGGGGPARAPASPPSEDVEDLALDLVPFRAAWPEVQQELPELVRAVLARGSWTDEHHRVVAYGGVLHVRHRPEVVKQVKVLLGELRGRLLRPLRLQVAVLEVPVAEAGRVFPRAERGVGRRFAQKRFAELSRGERARTLARVALRGTAGQWVQSDRLSNQTQVSGYGLDEGSVLPQVTALASGFTIQGAVWPWGAERAVVALSGLYTGPAAQSGAVSQTLHRALPQQKSDEKRWEEHQVTLELPAREMVELQGQLTVARGRWQVYGLLPWDARRLCAVVVRVDWSGAEPAPSRVNPLGEKGYRLTVIPIALPSDSSPLSAEAELRLSNRRKIEENAAGWFRKRADTAQVSQRKNTYNFKDKSGRLAFSPGQGSSYFGRGKLRGSDVQQVQQASGGAPSGPEQAGGGVMPARLEQLRRAVAGAPWPRGTALEFVANHVFVVHTPQVAAKVKELLEKTHAWRNRRQQVRLGFPRLDRGALDGPEAGILDAQQARALWRGSSLLPEAYLEARGGAWSQFFAGTMHAALSAAWAPDRASPPVHVFWSGLRVALRPHLVAEPPRRLELRLSHRTLEQLSPSTVAGAVVQQPVDSHWKLQRVEPLAEDAALLSGVHSRAGESRGVLLRAEEKTWPGESPEKK